MTKIWKFSRKEVFGNSPFIKQLKTQAYEYLPITSEDELVVNLRQQLEKLNDYTFSDKAWKNFFVSEIANPNQSIEEKTGHTEYRVTHKV